MKSQLRAIFLSVACLLLPTFVCAQSGKYTTFYEQRASLFECLPIISTDIVFLGNSLTNGCEWTELFGHPNIKNRGISGDEVMGVYDRLDPILKGTPAKIFLMIGVNDISHDLEADTIVKMIAKVVNKIKSDSPRTLLYIQSALPVNDSFTRFPKVHGKTSVIIALNEGLKQLSTTTESTYIDLYTHFVAPGTDSLNPHFTNDGLHLKGEGYLLWKEILLPYLAH
ncbi:MAG: GDSL-type esterase/lipase family protein [Bacteroides sp.]